MTASSQESLDLDVGADGLPDGPAFQASFQQLMAGYDSNKANWCESSELLRKHLREGPLSHFDMQKRPELFFLAHRLLPVTGAGGFGVRYTVQFNLFAGSVIGLGTDEEAGILKPIQQRGELGCFALTERSAGVMSGLIVDTECRWVPEKGVFVLNTGKDAAAKNWISQGLAAEWMVVIANLVVGESKFGPHGFVLRIRDSITKKTIPGLIAKDMGGKTVANDLDNASLIFENVEIPHCGMLTRYSYVNKETNQYVQRPGMPKMRIEVIGQRLLTGRLAIAQMSCEGVMHVARRTEEYCKNKPVHVGEGLERSLYSMGHLQKIFHEGYTRLGRIKTFSRLLEGEIKPLLAKNEVPGERLVEKIAVAKIKSLEENIRFIHNLEQEVGSFCLMAGTGYEQKDTLLCSKFAEGDSRILQQKLARDCLKEVSRLSVPAIGKQMVASTLSGSSQQRRKLWKALSLGRGLKGQVGAGSNPIEAWLGRWREVYELADVICETYIDETVAGRHLAPASRL